MERWDPDRLQELTDLVAASLPGESLSEDELLACLWEDDDPGIVIALEDATGAIAAVVRQPPGGAEKVAVLKLLAVAPGSRRKGNARELLGEVEAWARNEGAGTIVAGGSAPFYLWPGVDFGWTAALCLFEVAGYRPVAAEFNMSYPVTHRAPVPDGFVLRRVIDENDVDRVLAMCRNHWPNWEAETARAAEHASCLAVFDAADRVAGFGCHSVNRIGWLGPMATDPDRRAAGVGKALLGAIATDLRAAGRDHVEVAWVGPATFYAKAAGATVSRVFRVLRRRLS